MKEGKRLPALLSSTLVGSPKTPKGVLLENLSHFFDLEG
jgi:hypothetical protein